MVKIALKIWQIVLVIVLIFILTYFVFWLRRFLVERDIQRVKDKFQEPLSKVKFKDLDKNIQKILDDLRYDLGYKFIWGNETTMDLLITFYNEAKDTENVILINKLQSIMGDIVKAHKFSDYIVNKGIKIEVDGKNVKSPNGKIGCVYFESAVFFYTEQNEKNFGLPSTWEIGEHSAGAFSIFTAESELEKYPDIKFMFSKDEKTGKYTMKLMPNKELLLFVSPTFQKEFTKKTSPSKYAKRFEDNSWGESITLGRFADYCLQKGKEYYMLISKERYEEYGPPDKKGYGSSSQVTLIKISDKEFKNGMPQFNQTPTFKGVLYG